MALYMNGQEISQSSGVPIAVEGLTEIDSTGTAADILDGKIVYGYDSTSKKAKKLTGTMANNGAVAASIDGLTTMSYTIPAGYHNGSGKVTLTDDIENAKTAIATAIEGKGVTVPNGTLLDGMAPLIESIEAGGGVITGTFTVESDTSAHVIDYSPQSVDEWPSWLIVIAEKEETTTHSSFQSIWAIQVVYSNVTKRFSTFNYKYSQITYGYNRGNSRYYAPFFGSGDYIGATQPICNPNVVSSYFLAGVTYRYYMGIG